MYFISDFMKFIQMLMNLIENEYMKYVICSSDKTKVQHLVNVESQLRSRLQIGFAHKRLKFRIDYRIVIMACMNCNLSNESIFCFWAL